ncbi:MAG TPA: ABC transporter substrate-binding protein [Anaerolineae bacterium]|nr:ABC transporter substrate-binding protein [Anaerolineae bacterium]
MKFGARRTLDGPTPLCAGLPRLLRSILLGLLMMVAAGLTLVGCGQTTAPEGDTPTSYSAEIASPYAGRQGGTLVVGMAATSIATLDPAAYSDRATETVLRNIFDGLVTRTTSNDVVPELAQSFRWLDKQTVEFDLKLGVTFHNGEELTADDVVYTFDRILNQDVGAPRRGFVQEVASVEKVDSDTVRFHLSSPWPVFLQMLVHNQVVPQGHMSRLGPREFARDPAGSGPFRFVEGDLDDELVLERFEDYYGGADGLPPVGPPYLDRVIFRMMPDATSRVQALLAGKVHIIQSVPPSMVPQLSTNPQVTVKATTGTRPKFVDLNVTRPPFDDVRVRQALNYAVDAQRILDEVESGYGVILAGPLSPANLFADPRLEPYSYDPGKARELLAEAGYRPEDISFVLDAYGPYVEIAQALVEQLQGLGMDTTVQVMDYAELRPLLLNCRRQAFLRDWGDSAFDPVGYVEAKWQTYHPGTPAGRANYSCYSNGTVDELIEAGASEPDADTRWGIYAEMQRIIHEEAPAIFLYVPQEIEAASARVRNWDPSPDSRINLHDVWLAD